MTFTFKKTDTEIPYKNDEFWEQFDEIQVEDPQGWTLKYIQIGFITVFDYCQSTGGGNYVTERSDDTIYLPLNFTSDPSANAAIIKNLSDKNYNEKQAVFVKK